MSVYGRLWPRGEIVRKGLILLHFDVERRKIAGHGEISWCVDGTRIVKSPLGSGKSKSPRRETGGSDGRGRDGEIVTTKRRHGESWGSVQGNHQVI